MLRTNSSKTIRTNHHSIHHKHSPLGCHNTETNSLTETSLKLRKMSATSLKQNIPDIQKLISDIKIKPNNNRQNRIIQSRQTGQTKSQCIKVIMKALKELEEVQIVTDQVKAVTMLIQSIEKKMISHQMTVQRRNSLKNSTVKNSIDFKIYNQKMPPFQKNNKNRKETLGVYRMSEQKNIELNDVSPIKQMIQESSSRIVYSNFSIKELEKSFINNKNSEPNSEVKIAVSQFEQGDDLKCSSGQVHRLNEEIKYLQQLLAKKTMSQQETLVTSVNGSVPKRSVKECNKVKQLTDLFRKKSSKY